MYQAVSMWSNSCVSREIDMLQSKKIREIEYNCIWHGEQFEDTKGVIRICKSKKDRQHNGQKKKDIGTNKDLENTAHKTTD